MLRYPFGTSLLALLLLFAPAAQAFRALPAEPPTTAVDSAALVQATLDSINRSFHYATGKVSLPGSLGTIDVPKGLQFLDSAQSRQVLINLWGNPPKAADGVLGMLFPVNRGPLGDKSWGFVVQYEEMGYVEDDDADEIKYDDLLKEMQEDTHETNTEREKAGYEPIELVGWVSAPYYDKQTHALHWAKKLRFGQDGYTMNYDVRVLGRKGVMSLMAVGDPELLPVIKPHVPQLIANTKFADGLEYDDFDPKIDEVAAYSIGGLVAGKVLAKVGFFALILKFWKVGLAAVAIGWGAIKRFFLGRSADSEQSE